MIQNTKLKMATKLVCIAGVFFHQQLFAIKAFDNTCTVCETTNEKNLDDSQDIPVEGIQNEEMFLKQINDDKQNERNAKAESAENEVETRK